VELGTIEREIRIDASPEVVFDVVSKAEHVREWWPDEAAYDAAPGATGELVFGDAAAGGHVTTITVLDVEPPRRFRFRWTHPRDEVATERNSLLVTLELEPVEGGTLLRLTETGFREQGWEVAVLEESYRDHERGWDHFLPRLQRYAAAVTVR
jgi:uncharacterized protein YndB with AHSA1/START domain